MFDVNYLNRWDRIVLLFGPDDETVISQDDKIPALVGSRF